MIQQNASASEEMSSTAEELSSQAEQLQDTMAFFKLDSHSSYSAKRSVIAPPKPIVHHDSVKASIAHISTSKSGAVSKPTNGKAKISVDKMGGTIIDLGSNDKLDHDFEKF